MKGAGEDRIAAPWERDEFQKVLISTLLAEGMWIKHGSPKADLHLTSAYVSRENGNIVVNMEDRIRGGEARFEMKMVRS